MTDSTYIPLATLVLGWLLSEGSQYLRIRGNRLRSINKALSELLEIRFRTYASQATLNLISEKFNLGPIPRNQIRGAMPAAVLNDEETKKRFNDAITEVSCYDPFLAYKLRGKDILGTIENYFTSQHVEDERFHEITDSQLELLGNELLPVLDEVILEVAKTRGVICWWRTKRVLSKSKFVELPEKYVKFLDELKADMDAHSN